MPTPHGPLRTQATPMDPGRSDPSRRRPLGYPRATADLLKGLLVDRKLGAPAPTWQTTGLVTWHNGATRTSSAFAGALPNGSWVLIHRIGGTSIDTDRIGVELLRQQRDA